MKEGATAYIVNTDPHDEPGKHWIALWTEGNVCEIMDSYALSLDVYGTAAPLQEWMDRQFKYQMRSGKSLQSLFSQSCGDYALMFLVDRAEGRSMNDFLCRFKKGDYVNNDHKVGQWLKSLIIDALAWNEICKSPCHQDMRGSCSEGVYHLLHLY